MTVSRRFIFSFFFVCVCVCVCVFARARTHARPRTTTTRLSTTFLIPPTNTMNDIGNDDQQQALAQQAAIWDRKYQRFETQLHKLRESWATLGWQLSVIKHHILFCILNVPILLLLYNFMLYKANRVKHLLAKIQNTPADDPVRSLVLEQHARNCKVLQYYCSVVARRVGAPEQDFTVDTNGHAQIDYMQLSTQTIAKLNKTHQHVSRYLQEAQNDTTPTRFPHPRVEPLSRESVKTAMAVGDGIMCALLFYFAYCMYNLGIVYFSIFACSLLVCFRK